MIDDKPSIEERYATAARSGNLKPAQYRCDLDQMIAAGMVRQTLGTRLYRARAEFDAARGNGRLTGGYLDELRERRADLIEEAEAAARGSWCGPTLAGRHLAKAAELVQQIKDEALTARAMALVGMNSLGPLRRDISAYVEREATRRGFIDATPREAHTIAARVLEQLLDPLCSLCSGRGFSDGYLKPKVLCTSCSAGRRPLAFWRLEAEEFGRWMMADLERKMAHVDQVMSRLLSHWSTSASPGAAAQQRSQAATDQLARELDGLRSAGAASD